MYSLMYKSAPSNLPNCGSDATIEGALDGGVNIALKGAPLSSL